MSSDMQHELVLTKKEKGILVSRIVYDREGSTITLELEYR